MKRKLTQREKRKQREKLARKEANYVAVDAIYQRATQVGYWESESEPTRVEKILAEAQERRNVRNSKRIAAQPRPDR